MSTTTQRQGTTSRNARCWALVVALLLTASLQTFLRPQPPAGSTGPMSFFDSDEIKAASFVDDSANALVQDFEPSTSSAEQAPKLFGMDTELLSQGEVLKKWNSVRLEIARELRIVDRCRRENECPAGAKRLMSLSAEGAGRSGRARVGFINRAVDLAISPTNDEAQWHVPDHWNTPFETLQASQGDCEDYAIVNPMEAGNDCDSHLCRLEDCLSELLRSLLRRIVSDTAAERAVRIFTREFVGV